MVLVLDLDGVVVLGHPEGGRWDKHLARDLGIEPQRLQERFFTPHFQKIVTGETRLTDVLAACWPELECRSSPQELIGYWFANDSRLNTEVLEIVDRWRADGRRAFLGTVQEHERARHVWDVLGLSRHFDGILYSAELRATKPKPEFFQRAQERLGCSPGEVIFLDDMPKNVEAARAHGWNAHLYRHAEDVRSALGQT